MDFGKGCWQDWGKSYVYGRRAEVKFWRRKIIKRDFNLEERMISPNRYSCCCWWLWWWRSRTGYRQMIRIGNISKLCSQKHNYGRIDLTLPCGSDSSQTPPPILHVISEFWHWAVQTTTVLLRRHASLDVVLWTLIIKFSSEEIPLKVTYILPDCTVSRPRKPLMEV